MTVGGSGSGSGIGVVVPPPPPAQEEIISEATAMKNWVENTGQLNRFMIVLCHSKQLREDPFCPSPPFDRLNSKGVICRD